MDFSDLTPELGSLMLRYSRRVLEVRLHQGETLPALQEPHILQEKAGLFCTLKNRRGGLRGCIGLPYPTHRLGEALVNATIGAALEDPRFPPVTKEELPHLTIDLTVLTPPEKLVVSSPDEYLGKIKVGRDGLIVGTGAYSRGLLLPQVPVEQGWDTQEFLEGTCRKAMLPKDAWRDLKRVMVYRFQGQIFEEEKKK